MNQTVNKFVERHQLLHKGATVVVAVSGGPDSMALLHYLYEVQERWGLRLIVAHVDHMFRGEESHADLKYVEDYCKEKGLFFAGTRIDVQQYKQRHALSSQMAARTCRYHFFGEVMEQHKADYLALAHHGDDQVETMLMNQTRGSLGFGLAGIPVKRSFASGQIIRPFLGITKDEIEHYCNEVSIIARRDPTNETDDYLRNRFRHKVLPFLKKENPNVHVHFQKQSEWIAADHSLLERLAEEKLNDIILEKAQNYVTVNVKALNQLLISLQRRAIHLILNYLYGKNEPSLSFIHIEDFLHLIKSDRPSGSLHFPLGLTVEKSYDICRLTFDQAESDRPYHYQLEIPGMVQLKVGQITGEVISYFPKSENALFFVCDFEKLEYPLSIRTRLPGDRISPIGMNGSKKIKDLFIEEKVDLKMRDQWPLIVDGKGRVIWVPLLKRSSLAPVSNHTSRYLALTYKPSTEKWLKQ